jgi:serine/threonine protein kinase
MLDQYKLIKKLGHGSCFEVWEGTQIDEYSEHTTSVAIKFVKMDGGAVYQFEQEIIILAELQHLGHKNVMGVIEYDHEG